MTSIPLADAPSLGPFATRTMVVRLVLGALLAVLVVLAAMDARHPNTQTIVPLPPRSSAIVVLDVSASISADTYSRIGKTLSDLAHSGGRYGLVVFSDQAYEALPPGTPARDLEPLVRYFTVSTTPQQGAAQSFPPNPWVNVFSAGTQIGAGLDLARVIAFADELSHPVVILVSDLDDDPQDAGRLNQVLSQYEANKIPLRIVGLNPSPENIQRFKKLAPSAPVVQAGTLGAGPAPENRTPFPTTLVLLALGVAALLAAHELWGPRLEWRTA
jgi:hypothetical protein